MSKLEEFLLNEPLEVDQQLDVMVSDRIPFPFKIRAITEAENKSIKKGCQTVSFDKKSHQKVTDTNQELYLTRLAISCCVEPNFKNSELQAKYGVMGAEALVDKILRPGEYNKLIEEILKLNGFDEDINTLIDEAKNS
jgi:hypothetical protein